MDPREQIKAKIDIVPFIAEHIPLKQAGRNFKALCPFHGEKTPSFVVSPERQIWHCFGCNLGGDIFTFLMEFEKMEFLEALRTLAKRAGVKLTTLAPSKIEQVKERLFQINHLASEFYHYLLTEHEVGEKARDYLKKRGMKKQTIDAFKLGFAPAKWELLFDYLTRKKGFSAEEIEQAGLIIRSQRSEARGQTTQIRNPKYYDRFRDRIIFTLRDHRGNVVGFAGRLLDTQAKEAKYVNTPETPLYHKGELFYGLDVTREAIKKEDGAIIVEGEFDMLSSFQAGVANVVALKGTALTLMQAKLIKRFTQNVALAFDLDIAGDAAARRGIQMADNEGLNIKVIRAKAGKDPDEVIRKNPLAWKKAIKAAVSVYDFLIDSALSRFDKETPEGKKHIADEVLPSIWAISNEIVKAHFIKRLSAELDTTEEVIVKQMEKLEKPALAVAQQVTKPKPTTRQQVIEEYLMALLLQKGDKALLEKVHPMLEANLLQSQVLEKVLHLLLAFYERQQPFDIKKFVKDIPKELLPTVDRLYLIDTEPIAKDDVPFEIEQALRELKVLLLRRKMEEVAAQLKKMEKEQSRRGFSSLEREFSVLSTRLSKLTGSVH